MSLCDSCSQPGHCCMGFHLSGGAFHQPIWMLASDTNEEMRAALRGKRLPFLPIAIRSSNKDDQGRAVNTWWYGCPLLSPEGRCTDYENRPQLCRDYEPGTDALCVMTPPAVDG